jgi:hypothetical protein
MTENIENLEICRLTKVVQEQLGEDFASEDSIKKGIEEAFERNNWRLQIFERKAQEKISKKQEPFPCFNSVCPKNNNEQNSCAKNLLCYDCLFQMTSFPPSSLKYTANENEKMPSHQEALNLLVEAGLLKDESWENQIETIYFRNQKKPKTQYERGQIEIKGITMDQFRGIILNFLEEFFNDHKSIIGGYEFPPIAKDFDFTNEDDREIFAQNICMGIEKVMGIYPNIQSLR